MNRKYQKSEKKYRKNFGMKNTAEGLRKRTKEVIQKKIKKKYLSTI